MKIFMVGDVMLGRGVDQILPHSCPPNLHQSLVKDARHYVQLAVAQNGDLPVSRGFDYVWGNTIEVLHEKVPDLRIINLETSITLSESHWPNKVINYRMHPKNVEALKCFGVDLCVLGNNHVLDWGNSGLEETLKTLCNADIEYAGAGRNLEEAGKPAIFELPQKGRVVVFAGGHMSSGVPDEWKPSSDKAGVNIIQAHEFKAIETLQAQIKHVRKENDVVVLSIHWGGNWGYDVEPYHQQFAHDVIDNAGVDIVHGHSSHHVKGIEVYKGKLIIYGAGDWLNDYEGIAKHESYNGQFGLMYFADVNPTDGMLMELTMVPTQIHKLRVNRAEKSAIDWLEETMKRECRVLGTDVMRMGNELKLVFTKMAS